MVMQIGPCVAFDGRKPADCLRVSLPRHMMQARDTRPRPSTLGRPVRRQFRARVSRRHTATHQDFCGCAAIEGMRRHTPPLSDCFHWVCPCVACVPPKGGRAARHTRAAALPWGAR
jgi:hypothetical protein